MEYAKDIERLWLAAEAGPTAAVYKILFEP